MRKIQADLMAEKRVVKSARSKKGAVLDEKPITLEEFIVIAEEIKDCFLCAWKEMELNLILELRKVDKMARLNLKDCEGIN